MAKEERVMIGTRLKKEDWQKLKKYCKEQDISMSSLQKKTMRELLEKLEVENGK